ncbi:hypothetical protein GRJ2_000851400 [Grus japonensis]|uniref:Uncharacterized protein n=1 Tax=Grus japonensis TaxID=30415 RepID=A0ABC9WF33_GRUJA
MKAISASWVKRHPESCCEVQGKRRNYLLSGRGQRASGSGDKLEYFWGNRFPPGERWSDFSCSVTVMTNVTQKENSVTIWEI